MTAEDMPNMSSAYNNLSVIKSLSHNLYVVGKCIWYIIKLSFISTCFKSISQGDTDVITQEMEHQYFIKAYGSCTTIIKYCKVYSDECLFHFSQGHSVRVHRGVRTLDCSPGAALTLLLTCGYMPPM